jgi:hypothetical protein
MNENSMTMFRLENKQCDIATFKNVTACESFFVSTRIDSSSQYIMVKIGDTYKNLFFFQ